MQDATNQPIHSKWCRLQRPLISLALLVIVATAPADTLDRLSTGAKRIEGRTVCRVTLNADGTVARVEIAGTSGNKKLDFASVQTLRQWRAKPGRAGRYYNIPIRFQGGGSTLGNDSGMRKDGLGVMKSRDR